MKIKKYRSDGIDELRSQIIGRMYSETAETFKNASIIDHCNLMKNPASSYLKSLYILQTDNDRCITDATDSSTDFFRSVGFEEFTSYNVWSIKDAESM